MCPLEPTFTEVYEPQNGQKSIVIFAVKEKKNHLADSSSYFEFTYTLMQGVTREVRVIIRLIMEATVHLAEHKFGQNADLSAFFLKPVG